MSKVFHFSKKKMKIEHLERKENSLVFVQNRACNEAMDMVDSCLELVCL